MNVTHINPFLAATRDVFETMVRRSIKIGKPYVKRPDERLYKLYKVAATIGLAGAGRGLCVLNLSEPAALALAGGLTGKPCLRLDANCLKALGEIAEIIAGAARRRLAAGEIQVSTPAIVSTHQVVYPAGMPVIAVPADTGAGRFILELAYRRTAASSADDLSAPVLPAVCAAAP